MSGNNDRSPQAQFDAAISQYVKSIEDGKPQSKDSVIAQNPECANELRRFLEHHQTIRQSFDVPNPSTSALDAETLAHASTQSFDGSEQPLESMFGDFELVEEISRGGMGVVYRARHVRLNRVVALKMIRAAELASEEEVRRFYAEAEAAACLEHPGIVPIHDVGQFNGRHYLSMRFVEGTTLADRLRHGPLPPEEAGGLIKKIAQAIAFAHEHGVIHRDLKPANVLIDQSGEPMITDFGLAKNLNADQELTATGQILGTPGFMAPEQAKGDHSANTPIVDVYGIGALLYAVCTGDAPFQATNQIDVVIQVLDREPKLPSSINRHVPKQLEQICLRCLEKDPSNRYEDAKSIVEDIDCFLKGEPLVSGSVSRWHKIRRWAGREPALASHLAGIIATLAVVCTAYLLIDTDRGYFIRHSATLIVWAAASVLFQKLMNRSDAANSIRILWSAADVVFFTMLLFMAEPPRGTLLIGYPMLVAAAGLFNRVRLVYLTTAVCIASFSVFVVLSPQDEFPKPHFSTIFAFGLAVLGGIVGAIVGRLQKLRQYYEQSA